jgi:hypothetical protein
MRLKASFVIETAHISGRTAPVPVDVPSLWHVARLWHAARSSI